jgi:hypothetical protein
MVFGLLQWRAKEEIKNGRVVCIVWCGSMSILGVIKVYQKMVSYGC